MLALCEAWRLARDEWLAPFHVLSRDENWRLSIVYGVLDYFARRFGIGFTLHMAFQSAGFDYDFTSIKFIFIQHCPGTIKAKVA